MRKAMRLLTSFLTMGVVTITGVILFFRPIAEADGAAPAWPAPLALAVYAGLSILLLDWAAQRLRNSFSAAFIIATSQAILILDLLARGERGIMTAAAGIVLLAVTWAGVAFVHSKFSDS